MLYILHPCQEHTSTTKGNIIEHNIALRNNSLHARHTEWISDTYYTSVRGFVCCGSKQRALVVVARIETRIVAIVDHLPWCARIINRTNCNVVAIRTSTTNRANEVRGILKHVTTNELFCGSWIFIDHAVLRLRSTKLVIHHCLMRVLLDE